MSEFYWASDYAGIRFDGGEFYYGYEKTYCNKCKKIDCDNEKHDDNGHIEWCFMATLGEVETVIPYSKLKSKSCDDMFNVGQCLMAGIGIFLSKCTISLHE